MFAIFKKKGLWIGYIAVFLAVVTSGYFIGTHFLNGRTAARQTRTVEIKRPEIDYRSVLADFDDSKLTFNGGAADFVGYKTLDASILQRLDNLNQSDMEFVESGKICYHFTYDAETNVLTIRAEADLPGGSVLVDTISGVGFYNDAGEIDAVMNIDGEGILLSEMRDAGVIQNCGWFSNLIKAVAATVAVVAAVVAVAAVVVVTAGAAAPAIVAAGVAATTVTATAATIGTYAALTAAIAAGVYITVSMVDTIDFQGTKYKAEELTKTKIELLPRFNYYVALATTDGKMAFCAMSITRYSAIEILQANSLVSVYTFWDTSARSIAQEAGYNMSPIWEQAKKIGYFNHFHTAIHGVSHAFYGLPRSE